MGTKSEEGGGFGFGEFVAELGGCLADCEARRLVALFSSLFWFRFSAHASVSAVGSSLYVLYHDLVGFGRLHRKQ
jgi:hypothetical protein